MPMSWCTEGADMFLRLQGVSPWLHWRLLALWLQLGRGGATTPSMNSFSLSTLLCIIIPTGDSSSDFLTIQFHSRVTTDFVQPTFNTAFKSRAPRTTRTAHQATYSQCPESQRFQLEDSSPPLSFSLESRRPATAQPTRSTQTSLRWFWSIRFGQTRSSCESVLICCSS